MRNSAESPSRAIAGDRVSRHGGRPLPELTTRTEPADAVVIEPGTIAPGRARGAAPLRREGPAKLTGAAKYADDLVFPGAWYGATIRSTDAHATFDGARPRPRFRLVVGRGRHRGRHPGRQHRELDQARPADPGPARRRDPAPRRAAGPPGRPRSCGAACGAPRRPRPDRATPGGLRPARLGPRLRGV